MANEEHLAKLKEGVKEWNRWRQDKPPDFTPDLSNAELSGVKLEHANLSHADLSGADLSRAVFSDATLMYANLSGANLSDASLNNANLGSTNLQKANLSGAFLIGAHLRLAELYDADLSRAHLFSANLCDAKLRGAILEDANLEEADLSGAMLFDAKLGGANLSRASLHEADLSRADLSRADLERTMLIKTNLSKAILNECRVFGISAWGLRLEETKQQNLVITEQNEPIITVDNLEVAQSIYLLIKHRKIGDIITTIGEKAVLILGRFTPERKIVLDAIAEKLRELKYLPIIFDFEKIPGRDYTETIKILAGLSRFVIADITEPKSVPQESQAIIPDFKIPFVRLIQKGERAWSMSEDLNLFDWVIRDVIEYPDKDGLVKNLNSVVKLAEQKYKQLMEQRANNSRKTLSIEKLARGEND